MKPIARIFMVVSALVLVACGSSYQSGDFVRDYRQALEEHAGAPVEQAWVDHFTDTYGDFTGEDLAGRLRDLYASELFFNDTLHSHHDRSALIGYLDHTRERLDDMSLEFLDTRISGRDLYLRWVMRTEFRAGFRDVDARTIGMSHLRFNDNGKVILHQDFWDSRQGVFEHIPVVGGLIEWIRSDL